jgi:hypothetical protein
MALAGCTADVKPYPGLGPDSQVKSYTPNSSGCSVTSNLSPSTTSVHRRALRLSITGQYDDRFRPLRGREGQRRDGLPDQFGVPPAVQGIDRPGERFIVLDLSGVSFCDSAGLNVLLGAWREADASGADAGAGVCA